MRPCSTNSAATGTGGKSDPHARWRCALWLQPIALAATLVFAVGLAAADDYPREVAPHVFEVEARRTSEDGVVTHTIGSTYQPGDNALHVLLPAIIEPGRRHPVLYVLPVHPGSDQARAGLEEARRLRLHERYGLICIAPAFAQTPWYADHTSDPLARQESHLLHAVLPFVEHCYPVLPEAAGRLLVGFSKSGWGAFSLLLRHPEIFGRAASWDAPLAMQKPGRWGTDRVWITEENFARYCVINLLREKADLLRRQPVRLVLTGHGLFKDDDTHLHEMMEELRIPHHWKHGPERKHNWSSGWLEPAVTMLMAPGDSRF